MHPIGTRGNARRTAGRLSTSCHKFDREHVREIKREMGARRPEAHLSPSLRCISDDFSCSFHPSTLLSLSLLVFLPLPHVNRCTRRVPISCPLRWCIPSFAMHLIPSLLSSFSTLSSTHPNSLPAGSKRPKCILHALVAPMHTAGFVTNLTFFTKCKFLVLLWFLIYHSPLFLFAFI